MDNLTANNIANGIASLSLAIAIIISAAWIIAKIITALKQRANTRTEAQIYNRLIDKFETAPEFIAFLESDAGLKFIEDSAPRPAVMIGRILTSTQIGIVILLIGAGLLVSANIFSGPSALSDDFYKILTICGLVGLTIGIGLLISAAISYYTCKAWGLLTATDTRSST